VLKRHRIKLFAILVVLAGITAFAAYSYFNATGTASSTFSVGSDGGTVAIGVQPGGTIPGPGQGTTFNWRVVNPSPTQTIHVGTIRLNTSIGSNGFTGLPVGCLGVWFDVPNIVVNQTLPPSFVGTYTAAPINMVESGTDQSPCQGASGLTFNLVTP